MGASESTRPVELSTSSTPANLAGGKRTRVGRCEQADCIESFYNRTQHVAHMAVATALG